MQVVTRLLTRTLITHQVNRASYPQSIKESIAVWKKVPRSVYFLFISNLILTFAISLGQLFFSVYAVEGEKSVLNISQIDWALVSSALFIAMIIAAIR